ncbi:EF-hand [Rhizophagus irregularis]|uniref:EF-hand n=2 Tax=Rhizophagus irregularis TaxID=588596 RepID=A0A2I1HED5_9GLOM|nr:EF-hand [Rhizophagus irregularis]PKY57237.1 EF-hand [Rhizophagus irregularis]
MAEKLNKKASIRTTGKLDRKVVSKTASKLDKKAASKTTQKKAVITTNNLDKAQIKKIFDIFDYNGNGILSLAEIDKAVIELYPHLAKDKPAIMRAYKAADTSKDGFIDFKEFGRLIDLLHYYNELFKIFKKLDIDNDRRIDFGEFKKGHKLIGINVVSNKELKAKFNEIDTNLGGYILFDEFCIYAAKIKLISDIPQDTQDTQNNQEEIPQDVQNKQEVQETQTKL